VLVLYCRTAPKNEDVSSPAAAAADDNDYDEEDDCTRVGECTRVVYTDVHAGVERGRECGVFEG